MDIVTRGDGTLAGELRYAAGFGPWSVAAGDLDGDGALDLVVANGYSDDVSVRLNTCTRSRLSWLQRAHN